MKPADGNFSGTRIGLLTASVSTLGGGVAEAVLSQAQMIRELGAIPVIFALRDSQTDLAAERFAGFETHLLQRQGPAFFGYSRELTAAMIRADCAMIHLHGIWMYPSRAGAVWAAQTGKPYVISPHGMLDPWITARGRWKKALARAGYERSGWRKAARFHALTADEAQDISRETGGADISVIPNAGPPARHPAGGFPPAEVIFIGRIHPKKNLAALVEGWRRAATGGQLQGAQLTIAGWGDQADVAVLERLIATGPGNIRFIGPVHGAQKQELLSRARFMVLPSHSEGLPVAILEAWANGLPTLMSRACHLPQGFETGAALDCGTTPDTVARNINLALAHDQAAWQAMSGAALQLASGPFSAATVARQWADVYGSLATWNPSS